MFGLVRLICLLLGLFPLTVSAQCGPLGCPTDGFSSVPRANPAPVVTPIRPAANINPAIVRVYNNINGESSIGSGVLISKNSKQGLVLTAAHVFSDGVGKITVSFPDGNTYRGGLQKKEDITQGDEWVDLAAIVVEGRPSAQPLILSKELPKSGEILKACGYGRGNYGVIEGPAEYGSTPTSRYVGPVIALGRSCRQGDSGGAILGPNGEVVGIISSASNSRTVGTHCGRIRKFLRGIVTLPGRRRQPVVVQPPLVPVIPNDPNYPIGPVPVEPPVPDIPIPVDPPIDTPDHPSGNTLEYDLQRVLQQTQKNAEAIDTLSKTIKNDRALNDEAFASYNKALADQNNVVESLKKDQTTILSKVEKSNLTLSESMALIPKTVDSLREAAKADRAKTNQALNDIRGNQSVAIDKLDTTVSSIPEIVVEAAKRHAGEVLTWPAAVGLGGLPALGLLGGAWLLSRRKSSDTGNSVDYQASDEYYKKKISDPTNDMLANNDGGGLNSCNDPVQNTQGLRPDCDPVDQTQNVNQKTNPSNSNTAYVEEDGPDGSRFHSKQRKYVTGVQRDEDEAKQILRLARHEGHSPIYDGLRSRLTFDRLESAADSNDPEKAGWAADLLREINERANEIAPPSVKLPEDFK